MSTLKTAGQLVALAVTGSLLAACGNGGSQSSGTAITANNQYTPTYEKSSASDVTPVIINDDNAKFVAGSALKAMLLSDISASAVDSAVGITREQNSEIADMATGIVINMQPVNCLYGGNFTLQASLESTGDTIQLNLAEDISMTFNTTFNQCNQGMATMNGSLDMSFVAIINDLMATNNYTIDAQIGIDQLTIQQAGFTPFVINGDLSYMVSNTEGDMMLTEVNAEDMYYAADTSYQVLEYSSFKSVHLPTGAYEYSINSSYVDYIIEDSLIRYETIEPLTGVGFTVPTGGKLAVYGANDTMIVNVIDGQSIELVIDYGNDGVTDAIMYSTWTDLALEFLATP